MSADMRGLRCDVDFLHRTFWTYTCKHAAAVHRILFQWVGVQWRDAAKRKDF